MIKSRFVLSLVFMIFCGCGNSSKNLVFHGNEILRNFLNGQDHEPDTQGEGYFFFETSGFDNVESYTELILPSGGRKAVIREIFSLKGKGGKVVRKTYEVSSAEVDVLMEIIGSGGFWSGVYEQNSLGGGIALLGGWKAGVVKIHADIPSAAPMAKAEAWFKKVRNEHREPTSEPPEPTKAR